MFFWDGAGSSIWFLAGAALLLYLLGYLHGQSLWRRREGESRAEGEKASYYRGLHFLITDEPDKAIEEFTKAVRLNLETVEIYLSLGNLFRARGEVGRAIRIHQTIIARPNLPQETLCAALYALGEDYRQGGFVDRAVEAYRRVLEIDDGHQRAIQGCLSLHESEARWDHALERLRRLQQLTNRKDPRREAHLLVKQAMEFGLSGTVDEDHRERMLQTLREAITIFPGCVEAHRLLGEALLRQGQVEEAIQSFAAVRTTRPSHFFLLVDSLRLAYECRGDVAGFEQCLSEAVQAPAVSPRLMVWWSAWLAERERQEEAIVVLRRGLDTCAESLEIALQLATLLARKGCFEEAWQVARGGLERQIHLLHHFQCTQCGFRSRDIYWKCPQCHRWDTMEPL
ncbi:MAG: tetratricopeptide repeat protein [Magnetococcales bacterium]|nr:tetratricopeptide repeat protein [Magnetococcales bacterium]